MATVYYVNNSAYTWQEWNGTATGSSTQIVWQYWVDSNVTQTSYDPWPCWTTASNETHHQPNYDSPQLSDEERAARSARAAEALERAAEQRKQEEEARKAAERLLVSCLNRRQRSEYRKDRCFTVITRNGRRHYRIRPGAQPMRLRGEDGRRYRYCIHPEPGFPGEDVALSQKLLLESDEDAFLRIANASVAA